MVKHAFRQIALSRIKMTRTYWVSVTHGSVCFLDRGKSRRRHSRSEENNEQDREDQTSQCSWSEQEQRCSICACRVPRFDTRRRNHVTAQQRIFHCTTGRSFILMGCLRYDWIAWEWQLWQWCVCDLRSADHFVGCSGVEANISCFAPNPPPFQIWWCGKRQTSAHSSEAMCHSSGQEWFVSQAASRKRRGWTVVLSRASQHMLSWDHRGWPKENLTRAGQSVTEGIHKIKERSRSACNLC